MVLGLFPVSGPADHHSVVLQTSKPPNLDQVGRPISQVGGDDHLREALHLLCLHQLTQRLQIHSERKDSRHSQYRWVMLYSHVCVITGSVWYRLKAVPDLPSGPRCSCPGRFLELRCQRWLDPSLLSADWSRRASEAVPHSAQHLRSLEPRSEA